MKHPLISSALALAILFIGCRETFDVMVSQTRGGETTIQFQSSGLLGASGVEIVQVQVLHVIADDKPRILTWLIRRRSEKLERITHLVYGVVPPGFRVDIPAGALVRGEAYEILASSAGGIGGVRFIKE